MEYGDHAAPSCLNAPSRQYQLMLWQKVLFVGAYKGEYQLKIVYHCTAFILSLLLQSRCIFNGIWQMFWLFLLNRPRRDPACGIQRLLAQLGESKWVPHHPCHLYRQPCHQHRLALSPGTNLEDIQVWSEEIQVWSRPTVNLKFNSLWCQSTAFGASDTSRVTSHGTR